MTTLTQQTLSAMRSRRESGTKIKELAAEIGVTWQRLDKALRHSAPAPTPERPEPETPHAPVKVKADGDGAFTERYRPRNLAAIVGQPHIVRKLAGIVANPRPMAMLFEGETGTGKTSAAKAFAADLGCDGRFPELGGLYEIASGEQTADSVRATYKRLWNRPFYGSGWKVVIVNEADRMHPQAETVWLDRLENLPPYTIIIFTTNHPEDMSPRFRDRCLRLSFTCQPTQLRPAARALLAAIWRDQTGKAPIQETISSVLDEATERGRLSLRRAVTGIENRLMELA